MATITRTSPREAEQLRRALGGADQGPTALQQAGNNYGRDRMMNGAAYQDPTAVSFPFLRRMRRDHIVSMGLHFINLPIIKASWYFEADDARMAAFADNLIRPIYGQLVEAILRFLWSGYSPMVKNYKTVNPNWMYVKDGKQVPVWTSSNVDALVYKKIIPLRPETARPQWDDKGAFNGIIYDGRYGSGTFSLNGQNRPDIDINHALWAVHDQMGEDGSPWGFPRIAHCAPIFYMYRLMWKLLSRAFENSADPGPVVRFPSTEPTEVINGRRVTVAAKALMIAKSRRSGTSVALPSDVWMDFQDKPTSVRKWDIEYPKVETNFESIHDFIGHLESAKLRALWLQEGGLIGGSGDQSSRNVASEFGAKRDESQAVLMGQVIEFIMENLVRPAMAANFPEYTGRLEMKPLGFGQDDEDIVRQIFQLELQGDKSGFGIDVRRLAASRGLPMLSWEEMEARRKQAVEDAQKAITPTVNPDTPTKPGEGPRRAQVTQTGFGETMYVQLGENLGEIRGDEEFLSELPRTDTYADTAVVATARDIRTESKSYLSFLYSNFAKYVARADLELDDELSEDEITEHFAGDKVNAIVQKVMLGWKPRSSRVTEFSAKTRDYIGRVYSRTTQQQLKKLKSNAATTSIDRAAATWLDERGAEMVSSVNDTTRRQLAELLAEGVRNGLTNKQIAAEIRTHFAELPAQRAATIARTETSTAYNYATIAAGTAAGVKMAQLIDGNQDAPCKKRNGKILSLADALKEKLAHPNCTLTVRLLPKAGANLSVETLDLEGGMLARFDTDHELVMFSPRATHEQRAGYLVTLGDRLAEPALIE